MPVAVVDIDIQISKLLFINLLFAELNAFHFPANSTTYAKVTMWRQTTVTYSASITNCRRS